MKDMGICTPLEVADWLVETFRKLGQDDMALRLEKFLQPPQGLFPSGVHMQIQVQHSEYCQGTQSKLEATPSIVSICLANTTLPV